MRPFALYLSVAVAATLCLSSCSGQKAPTARTYELGQRVELGHLIYTVFETQWLPQIGTGASARIPRNRFFLVRISAVDSGADEVIVPNLTVLDDEGKSYEELSNGDGVPQWTGYLRSVKPADSISGNIVFDVTPRHYKLRLTDETGEKVALVDIPLSFNAETPNLPLPTKDTASPFRK